MIERTGKQRSTQYENGVGGKYYNYWKFDKPKKRNKQKDAEGIVVQFIKLTIVFKIGE